MPEYNQLNFLEHSTALPEWFWTGKTKMNCLKHAIGQSLDHAYAHHIQRLMVTGNFALLAGVNPDELDKWYLGIYIDALDWVEITNTRGMSQFADGGIVGTKPYVSSAAYIDKMSDYCGSCYYKKSEKVGERACPFNSLYWNFYDRHADKLKRNPRIGMMYKVWERMSQQDRTAILEQAEKNLERINEL
jgi:deoxyribodipyrimidine photolyase-related protein